MTELMRHHPSKFRRRQIRHQRQADGQDEIIAKHAELAARRNPADAFSSQSRSMRLGDGAPTVSQIFSMKA